MTYSWTLFDKLKECNYPNKGIGGLVEYLAHDVGSSSRNAYRMVLLDKSRYEFLERKHRRKISGKVLELSMVFCGVVNGMPLVL